MKQAIQRHQENTAYVIPILLRPVDWTDTPFSQIQMLPTNAKPVTSWSNTDEAYRDIAIGIRRAVVNLHNKRIAENALPPVTPLESKQVQYPIDEIPELFEQIIQPRITSSRRSPIYRLEDDDDIIMQTRPTEPRFYRDSYALPSRVSSIRPIPSRIEDEPFRRRPIPSQKTGKQPPPTYPTWPLATTRRPLSTGAMEASDISVKLLLVICLLVTISILFIFNPRYNLSTMWMLIGVVSGLTTSFFIKRQKKFLLENICFGMVGAINGGFALNFFYPQWSWPASLICAWLLIIAIDMYKCVKGVLWISRHHKE